MHWASVVLKYRPNMYVCFFFVTLKCHRAIVDVGPVAPASACSKLGLMAGTKLYSHGANQGQKKKKKDKKINYRTLF